MSGSFVALLALDDCGKQKVGIRVMVAMMLMVKWTDCKPFLVVVFYKKKRLA